MCIILIIRALLSLALTLSRELENLGTDCCNEIYTTEALSSGWFMGALFGAPAVRLVESRRWGLGEGHCLEDVGYLPPS